MEPTRHPLLLTLPLLFALAGCGTLPPQQDANVNVVHWSQTLTQAPLRLRLEWAMPQRPGPHPTVIVHPGLGQDARELRGFIAALAADGYLAVAVDYQRRINGSYSDTLFPWRSNADSRLALSLILGNPLIDKQRVASLGFSLGGAHTLLLAAANPQIRAVIAYYPMSDFPAWIAERRDNLLWRAVFAVFRWRYNTESAQHGDASHRRLLRWYSAVNHSEQLSAPVLLIHGDSDKIAPLHHSQHLEQRLQRQGSDSTLLIIPGAGHAFNTRPSSSTERSWEATLGWLRRYLSPDTTLAQAPP